MTRVGIGGIELTGADETIVAGGLSLPVHVYRPEPGAERPSAALILCPGGIGTGMFEIMEWIAGAARDAGIFTVTTSWRAPSPEHDPDDVSMVVDWLQQQPDVDGERIAIMGMSRGGNATLRAAALDTRLKLVVTFGPATNFVQQAEGTAVYAPGRHRMLVDWLGDPVEKRSFYEKVQAIGYADRIKQPVLMVHGQHDMHSPPEQSIWMKEAIEAAGNSDVDLRIVPMMGHYGDVIPNSYGFDQLRAIIIPYLQQRLK
ncbi:prolyl oligopeptidase family serine peptidase [Sphingomonas naphthae]|uniref:Prolyl oligopeptidase family serine peptidase n=1 Tax=Sphingomonas naphthae TaxID=1813468 RepID=A0ABY7TPD1_9SPHN|nr:prolyl oligopeptidase family serine peptidase [Sphingomonas naphthae]WCT74487.1 prolyl oligopeptidase family serine peptidase [Sphingomonas naphthae]